MQCKRQEIRKIIRLHAKMLDKGTQSMLNWHEDIKKYMVFHLANSFKIVQINLKFLTPRFDLLHAPHPWRSVSPLQKSSRSGSYRFRLATGLKFIISISLDILENFAWVFANICKLVIWMCLHQKSWKNVKYIWRYWDDKF